MRKILSVILAVVIVFTTVSISVVSNAAGTEAYIQDNKYYRFSNGAYVECYLDIDELACEFQNDVLNRYVDGFSDHYFYASPEYVDMDDSDSINEMQIKIEKELQTAFYVDNNDDPRLGQYLEKSGGVYFDINIYPSDHDTPINGVVYHTYGITLSIDRELDEAEEKYISKFAEVFKEKYISQTADDYTKVKTIYDFVIRNCEYDEILFQDKINGNQFPRHSDRFRIAHSAYGAIIGNRLKYTSEDPSKLAEQSDIRIKYDEYKADGVEDIFIDQLVRAEFDQYFGYKIAINDEKIVKLNESKGKVVSNGRAVCEGYSKLFYYLCVDNGIEARIVDGDYVEYTSTDPDLINQAYGNLTSGKQSDPHEWNYVKLDDGAQNDDGTYKGDRWFIVDTTWGSQLSVKNIDYNNYEYFLIGTKYTPDGVTPNPSFSVKHHQQPYFENGAIEQFYNWYASENSASDTDYDVPLIDMGAFTLQEYDQVIIERKTDYNNGEGEKCSYILQGANSAVKILLDDDNGQFENVEGFEYNGRKSAKYTLIIPYLTGYEYQCKPLTNVSTAGEYSVTATGMIVDGTPTSFDVKFKIVPVDMSNSTNYSVMQISDSANYNGNEIKPNVKVVDGHNNSLTTSDYDINIYQNNKKVVLKEMGSYDISIDFKGNYSGSYKFKFVIGKIDLSSINLSEYSLPYLPEFYRKESQINSAADFFNKVSSLSVGTQKLEINADYKVTSTGNISSIGDSGTLTISASQNSTKCINSKVGSYKVVQKFDISGSGNNGVNLNNQAADSNRVNQLFYDGTAKKPTVFDNLDSRLVRGKDYKIVSYSNNVNAGTAKVKIEGVGGCTGTATMYFLINPANITTAKITPTMSNSKLNVSVVWNGKTLVQDADYNLTSEKLSANNYLITITGINNFAGVMKINATLADPTSSYVKPTATGNTIKLSKTKYTYSGSACKPTVSFVNGKGQKINSHYYTVSYSNNTKVGTAKVTLKLRNGYEGSIVTTFFINPKGTTLSSLTAKPKAILVKWKKQATQTTGYQIQIATNSKFTSGVKTYETKKNTVLSTTISKLTGKKKYYVRVRTYKTVSGKKYYSSWSASKYVTTKK